MTARSVELGARAGARAAASAEDEVCRHLLMVEEPECKDCRRSCRNISWSHYLPQSSPVFRISASRQPRGPLRALGSNTPAPALQRRRHPSLLQPCPAHLPAHGLLGVVVTGWPSFPVTPWALNNKTTIPSSPRSGSLQHSLPGTPVLPPRQTLDFKSQEASRVRFPDASRSAEAPSVPRTYFFSVITTFF